MAKLCPYYSLCPVIETKNFLGVSDDSLSGCVIVTLAKNIVIRYKLSCQKQISSWSSKDKLSAPVIFDSINNRYIGVFNNDQISHWKVNSHEPLDNFKKKKFIVLIHCVLSGPGIEPIIVYKNGCVALLSTELENRKNPQCEWNLQPEQNLEDAKLIHLSGTLYVYLFSRSYDNHHWFHLIPVDSNRGEKSEIKMVREEGVRLMAYTVTEIETNQLITFWSDGKVFSLDLPSNNERTFPGRFVSVLTGINPERPAVMVPVSAEHVAVYGADLNSEGAVLSLFNVRFGLVQSSTQMKLYTSLPKLWRCAQSLFLVVGQYLAVVPYKLATLRLATLVGSQVPSAEDADALAVETCWIKESKKHRKKSKETKNESQVKEADQVNPLMGEIRSRLDKGLTEITICDELFPGLLDSKDAEGLSVLMTTLGDIPEVWLVETVIFCMGCLPERRRLLEETLDVSLVNDGATLRLLRERLPLDSVLALFWELVRLLKAYPANPRYIDWASLLLDSHYQQYLLSKDQKVIEALAAVKQIVVEHLDFMKDTQMLVTQILRLSRGEGSIKKPSSRTNQYAVEELVLY